MPLGTTHISLAVYDLASGRCLAERWGKNPQGRFGADVVTRLLAAERPEMAQTLAFAARNAIGEAIDDVTRREGLDPRRLGRVTVVGNSAMLALLAGPGAIDSKTGKAAYSYAHPLFWAPFVLVGD